MMMSEERKAKGERRKGRKCKVVQMQEKSKVWWSTRGQRLTQCARRGGFFFFFPRGCGPPVTPGALPVTPEGPDSSDFQGQTKPQGY